MVKQLIYKSQCVTEITPDLVETIIFAAARFNEVRGISGILLYSENVFLQLLEGDPVEVDDLYKRILADPRHMNIKTVYLGYAENRTYPNWEMRAYSSSESPIHMLDPAQREFITSADPLAGKIEYEASWIGSFMRTVCKDHLPEKRPDRSKFN